MHIIEFRHACNYLVLHDANLQIELSHHNKAQLDCITITPVDEDEISYKFAVVINKPSALDEYEQISGYLGLELTSDELHFSTETFTDNKNTGDKRLETKKIVLEKGSYHFSFWYKEFSYDEFKANFTKSFGSKALTIAEYIDKLNAIAILIWICILVVSFFYWGKDYILIVLGLATAFTFFAFFLRKLPVYQVYNKAIEKHSLEYPEFILSC